MGTKTGISWTDATWNPIRGCSRVSEGCRHCYAESIAHRFSGAGLAYEGLVQLNAEGKSAGKWNGQIKFVEEHLSDPLHWKGKPIYDAEGNRVGYDRMRIFVNSMSDLFHENVTDEMRDRIFAVMALCPQHTFQVLTKRPERMLSYLGTPIPHGFTHRQGYIQNAAYVIKPGVHFALKGWPLPNVQLGVSVEDQEAADERIPLLLQTPAAVRFISAEPLLGPIDLTLDGLSNVPCSICADGSRTESDTNANGCGYCDGTGKSDELALDWVIVGGESGAGARPMHPDWARSLRDQCKAAGVPFFFKQWGEWLPVPRQWPDELLSPIMVGRGDIFLTHGGEFDVLGADLGSIYEATGTPMRRVGTKAAGYLLDGVEHHEFPAVSA